MPSRPVCILAISLILSVVTLSCSAAHTPAAHLDSEAKAAVLGPRGADAETSHSATKTTGATHTTSNKKEPSALDYLDLLDKKNKDVRSMEGNFVQTNISVQALETHVYKGHFYYLKPNHFRIDYTGERGKKDASTLLMLADTVWLYVPSIEQVTRSRLDAQGGQQREINQFLLGFGVQAKKALEYFNVRLGKRDPSGKSFTLIFKAKNPDQTLQFVEATITFNRASLQPQSILLVDSVGDKKEIDLGSVKFNTTIKTSRFEPKWPKGTEIIDQ